MPQARADGTCADLLLTRQQARSLGFTDVRINSLLRSGRWWAVHPGVLVTRPGGLALDDQCRAALLYQDRRATISHSTAARLHGLPDIPRRAGIELTMLPPRTRRQQRGLIRHWPHLSAEDITEVRGLPCTTAGRTVADIARAPEMRRWAIMLADAALRQGLTTPDDLAGSVDRVADRRDAAVARRALSLADGRSRSPQESHARIIFNDAGLPAPEPNWALHDGAGTVVAIGDLVLPQWLLWFEYDGVEVHSSPAAFQADRVRERLIRGYGFEVIRLVRVDLRIPGQLVAIVSRELAAAPERISRLPPGLSPYVRAAQQALWAGVHRPAS